MLLRGWILPVGGTTPDRHKAGTLPPCWLRGVQPPTGTKSERSPFAGCGMLIIKYRLGASVRICFCRSATEPVGGFTPDRNDPPPPNICLSSQTTGTLPPAKYPSTLPNSSTPPLPNPSHFPRPSNALAWVDHSGRGIQPPTGTKSERSPFAGCGMLIIKYRLGASVRICFCRSATAPVGGCTPDRHKDGRHSSTGTRTTGIPRPAQGRPAFRNRRRMTDARGGAGAFTFRGGGRLPGPPASWGRG